MLCLSLKELACGSDGLCTLDCSRACEVITSREHLPTFSKHDLALEDKDYIPSWEAAIKAANEDNIDAAIVALTKPLPDTTMEAKETSGTVRFGLWPKPGLHVKLALF